MKKFQEYVLECLQFGVELNQLNENRINNEKWKFLKVKYNFTNKKLTLKFKNIHAKLAEFSKKIKHERNEKYILLGQIVDALEIVIKSSIQVIETDNYVFVDEITNSFLKANELVNEIRNIVKSEKCTD